MGRPKNAKTQRITPPTKHPRVTPKARVVQLWRRTIVRTPKNPHQAFRLTRPRFRSVTSGDLKAAWKLHSESWAFIFEHKRLLLGLGVLYAVLAYVLVGGISQVDFVTLKNATTQVVNGDFGAFGTATSLFGAALTGNLMSPPSDVQQFMSAVLVLFFWLAIVWTSRMLMADKEITLRDSLYNSGAPIIPTLVVLSIMVVQLIPGAIGVFAYVTALNGGWLSGGVESMTFAFAALLLCLLSAYFVVSSLVGLIVVSLPGTYPWQALRTARGMVMNRRWGLVLRTLTLAVQMLIIWAVVMIPIFLLDGWLRFDWLPLVPIFAQVLIGLTLVYTSVYMYRLYRSLL